MDRKRSRLRGFTLLELMIVIAILAVLAGILVPSVLSYIRVNKINAANEKAQTLFGVAQEYLTSQQLNGAKPSDFSRGTGKMCLIQGDTYGPITNVALKPVRFDTRVYISASDYNINDSVIKTAVDGEKRSDMMNAIADGMSGDFRGSWAVAFYPETFTVAYVVFCDEKPTMTGTGSNHEAVKKVAYSVDSSHNNYSANLFTSVFTTSSDSHAATSRSQEGCAERGDDDSRLRQYVGQYPIPFTP